MMVLKRVLVTVDRAGQQYLTDPPLFLADASLTPLGQTGQLFLLEG